MPPGIIFKFVYENEHSTHHIYIETKFRVKWLKIKKI